MKESMESIVNSDVLGALREMARRIDALEKRIEIAVVSIKAEQEYTNRLGIRVLALEEQRDDEAAMVNYSYPKPEGVYVKPGDPVEWFGEQAVVGQAAGDNSLYLWVCRDCKIKSVPAYLKDMTHKRKPVLGLEGER
jgi:hypothetical protein